MKVTGWWITSFPVDLGELSLCENWALLITMAVHLSSSVTKKYIIRGENRNDSILSLCLAPTLNSMNV